jgi:hypothetical protein
VIIGRRGGQVQELHDRRLEEEWKKNLFVAPRLWELRLNRRDDPTLARLDDGEWSEFCKALRSLRQEAEPGRHSPAGELIQPAPDLDGDGVGDLVFVFGRFVLAVSGKEGKLLWCRELHSNVFLEKTGPWGHWCAARLPIGSPTAWGDALSLLTWGVSQSTPQFTIPLPEWSAESETALAGPPFVVADIDGDGRPDLILAHGAFKFELPGREGVVRPCVEALSGRTGATVWRHEPAGLAERIVLTDTQHGRRVIEQVRRGDLSELTELEPFTGFASFTERTTDGRRVLLAGLLPGLERLDPRTGRPVAPPDPLLKGEYAGRKVLAWSADGKTAIVEQSLLPLFRSQNQPRAPMAIDASSGEELGKSYPFSSRVFADLDGDGVPEGISLFGVFDGESRTDRGDPRPRWEPRLPGWRWSEDGNGGRALLVGPDLDGDGCRDLFVAGVADGERFGRPPRTWVLVAGLCSGKDGRLLWLTAEPIPGTGEPGLHFRHPLRGDYYDGAVFYWQPVPGAAGHFVVNVVVAGPDGKPDGNMAFLFAADTGRRAHVWPGVTVEGIADLDGDGWKDLYGRSGDQLVTARGAAPQVWRRPGHWRWQYLNVYNDWLAAGLREREPKEGHKFPATYVTGPVPDADLDGDGIADVPRLFVEHEYKCQAYSGRDGRPLWPESSELSQDLKDPDWVECLDLEVDKRPVVVMWGGLGKYDTLKGCGLYDGRTGKRKWTKPFPGEPRPDLLYRQPNGHLALVYQEDAESEDGRKVPGGLVAVNAAGEEVHRAPFPAPDAKGELSPPEGFEFRPLASLRLRDDFALDRRAPGDNQLWRFDDWNGWQLLHYPDFPHEVRNNVPYPAVWRVDPSDSALTRFYDIGDDRLTLLHQGIPKGPATEAPTRRYPDEVVLKRPLPWLDRARADAAAGFGCLAAYLALAAVLAVVGRRKTALLLLALLVLLPAYLAVVGLVLALLLLVAALPWKVGRGDRRRPLDCSGTVWGKSALVLLLLPAALLAYCLLVLQRGFGG